MDTEWTEEEIEAACAFLKKIEYCQDTRKGIPAKLFEAHLRTYKRVSTELVVLRNDGQEAYLVRRPSREDSPHDPYADSLHFPGVTHQKWETTEETFDRLRATEGVAFERLHLIAEPETDGSQRGSRCLMRIFVAQQAGEMTNPRGAWYRVDQIPVAELVASHRDLILPALRSHLEVEARLRSSWQYLMAFLRSDGRLPRG